MQNGTNDAAAATFKEMVSESICHSTIFIRLKNVKLLCNYELIKQNCVQLLCLLTMEYNENTVTSVNEIKHLI